jgi:hypothetical protein
MKITGPPPPAVLPWQDDPSRSAIGRRGDVDMFGFDELGVFGPRRLNPVAGTVERSAPPGPGPPLSVPEKTPAPRIEPLPSSYVNSGRHSDPLSRPGPDRPSPRAVPPGPGSPPEPGRVERGSARGRPEIAFDAETKASSRTDEPPEARLRPAVARPDFNVQLIEKGGQIGIAVSAPPLDGEGRNLLRRLVREMLAGRGLSLAGFRLNGVPLGADFSDITGGSIGSRSR